MTLSAALFDLDGTLLDTLDDLADSMNFCLQAIGAPAHPIEAYKYFVGDGVANLARRALPESRRDEATVARMVAAMRTRYAEHWADKTRPYDGVAEMLEALARKGIALAVLSNKPDDFTKVMIAKYMPGVSFAAVVGARASVPMKPDPAAALEIASQMRVSPASFAYLGDTATDMQTAVAAGMFPVGALWGFRPKKELLDNGARVVIEHPADFVGVFSGDKQR